MRHSGEPGDHDPTHDRQALPNRWAPAAKRIIHDWRRLTAGGAPTIIACSGGADSSALALALAAARAPITLITIRHHERPSSQTDADIERVRALADRLATPLAIRDLPRDVPHTEGAMRAARYALLADAAASMGIRFIATGHHADDQLESMLLALVRGTGVHGLRGIAPKRRLPGGPASGNAVRLIRPMLAITRDDAESICREANWAWATDSTNTDTRRARAALRAEVIPKLEAIRPGVALRAARTAGVLRDASALLNERVRDLLDQADRTDGSLRWARQSLRTERPGVIAGAIRAAALQHAAQRGRDALGNKALAPIVRAIRDRSTEPRAFGLRDGMGIRVTAHEVSITFDDGA